MWSLPTLPSQYRMRQQGFLTATDANQESNSRCRRSSHWSSLESLSLECNPRFGSKLQTLTTLPLALAENKNLHSPTNWCSEGLFKLRNFNRKKMQSRWYLVLVTLSTGIKRKLLLKLSTAQMEGPLYHIIKRTYIVMYQCKPTISTVVVERRRMGLTPAIVWWTNVLKEGAQASSEMNNFSDESIDFC